jgi:hypothetical protein
MTARNRSARNKLCISEIERFKNLNSPITHWIEELKQIQVFIYAGPTPSGRLYLSQKSAIVKSQLTNLPQTIVKF